MRNWWQLLISFLSGLGIRWLHRTRAKDEKIRNLHKAGADVANRDADAVNRRIEDARTRKGFAVPILAALSLCLAAGCILRPAPTSSAPMAIESDRAAYPMTSTNGVPGWFVPDSTMKFFMQLCQEAIDKE